MVGPATKQTMNTSASDDAAAGHGKDTVNGTSKHPSLLPTHSSSNSAVSSREVSPIRPLFRSMNSSSTSRSASRSRKNSEDSGDVSVNNLQNKLPNVNKPHLPPPPPSPDHASDARAPRKPSMPTKSGDPPLQWPVSPRLRSPPPRSPSSRSLSRTSSPKPQDDPNLANTSHRRQSSPNSGDLGMKEDDEDTRSRPTPRVLTRGVSTGSVLETVQEAGTPVSQTPSKPLGAESGSDTPNPKATTTIATTKSAPDSGSDSGGNKAQSKDKQRVINSHKPGDIIAKRSFTTLNPRGKPGESSMKNMIVETETVSSIPQLALGVGPVDRNGAGQTLRLKASDETIRPRKEKKRQPRKTTTIPSGTGEFRLLYSEASNKYTDHLKFPPKQIFLKQRSPAPSMMQTPPIPRRPLFTSRTPTPILIDNTVITREPPARHPWLARSISMAGGYGPQPCERSRRVSLASAA